MARGRAWGNALGGYRKQKRDSRGRFSGGKAGPARRAVARRKGRPKASKMQVANNVLTGASIVAGVGLYGMAYAMSDSPRKSARQLKAQQNSFPQWATYGSNGSIISQSPKRYRTR